MPSSSTSSNSSAPSRLRLVILMPVFDDFAAASLVCRALDRVFAELRHVEARVLMLDDGSPRGLADWSTFCPEAFARVERLELRRNLGHQRAIAVGLCHLAAESACDAVLVMDADGEDRPEDVPRLLAELQARPDSLVFAERRKRLEGVVFRLGYVFYRALHRVLTGIPVRIGNFSVMPAAALQRLVCMPELWNHYAGAALRSRLPQHHLPIDRGTRVLGRSRMGGLVPLIMHGITGIATFHDLMATRLLVLCVVASALLAAAFVAVVGIRLFTSLAIPGWATYTVGLLLVLAVQISSVAFGLVFTLVSERPRASTIPCRDYATFLGRVETLCSRA